MTIVKTAPGQDKTTDTKPFFFFQAADPQFGFFTNNNGFAKETENFEKVIQAANKLHPAFVIVCGDLVNGLAGSHPEQIDEYQRIAAKLNPYTPLYNVAGNHDVMNRPTHASLKQYREKFGADYYTFRSHDLLGIVINSSLFFNPSGAPREAARQATWLQETLKKTAASGYGHIVIFEHHPWFVQQRDEKDGYFNIPQDCREIYLDLFHQYGVKYVFAGHLHRNAISRDGDLTMVTTGPIGRPLGKDPSGFRIVIVDGDKMSYKYYSLDAIPDHIVLPR